jgi:hypothetical protein
MENKPRSLKLILVLLLATMVFLVTMVLMSIKPDWWPEEYDYPPEKPESWEGKWPPNWNMDEWLEFFRNRNNDKPEESLGISGVPQVDEEDSKPNSPTDRDFSENGYYGSYDFLSRFKWIFIRDGRLHNHPDCGEIFFIRTFARANASCKPYPKAVIENLCNQQQNRADDKCKRICAERETEREPKGFCPHHLLRPPPMAEEWGCNTSGAFCQGMDLCQCFGF